VTAQDTISVDVLFLATRWGWIAALVREGKWRKEMKKKMGGGGRPYKRDCRGKAPANAGAGYGYNFSRKLAEPTESMMADNGR